MYSMVFAKDKIDDNKKFFIVMMDFKYQTKNFLPNMYK